MLRPLDVFVRVRPLSFVEHRERANECVQIYSDKQVGVGDSHFTFDRVFPPQSSQEEVFGVVIRPLLEQYFQGYNVTCLAYGQTGGGKTYTMGTGVTEMDGGKDINISFGILPRLVRHIFDTVKDFEVKKEGRRQRKSTVTVQFVEIYNEEIIDLLGTDERARTARRNVSHFGGGGFGVGGNKRSEIQIRDGPDGEAYLVGAEEVECLNENDALRALQQGAQLRTVGATGMNAFSSRSHAIFTITLRQMELEDKQKGIVDKDIKDDLNRTNNINRGKKLITSKFNLVDLAGSERQKRTGNVGQQLKESIAINSGLLSLGKVINALSAEGGNSLTHLIACISPAESSFEETRSTLGYASRAKLIKNAPIQNIRDQQKEQANQKLSEKEQLKKIQNENVEQQEEVIDLLEQKRLLISELDDLQEDWLTTKEKSAAVAWLIMQSTNLAELLTELTKIMKSEGIFNTKLDITMQDRVQLAIKPITGNIDLQELIDYEEQCKLIRKMKQEMDEQQKKEEQEMQEEQMNEDKRKNEDGKK
ncbi:MAG: putative Chromosome-associated kinesin KIF4 [Streblomastix strix]|uniref:Kinesin-like protein n=1 Tax=Streblomastix strix TaxID=222440 RepID=A0A5J4WPC2_9EUKA|nr:MAG: putative Chromosome-associated kinesin KIF4 [Streblomastix strix]